MGDTLSEAPTNRPGEHHHHHHHHHPANDDDDEDDQYLDMPMGMVYGENGAPAFAKIGNAALEFFANCIPDAGAKLVCSMLRDAWEEDPTTALQLIFQTGNVRNGGKMDRENFYTCIMWLWDKAPDTLLLNLRAIPTHTCVKDLLEVLTFVLHGRMPNDPLSLQNSVEARKRAHLSKQNRRIAKMTRSTASKEKRSRRTSRHARRLCLKEAFAATLGQPLSTLLLCDGTPVLCEPASGDTPRHEVPPVSPASSPVSSPASSPVSSPVSYPASSSTIVAMAQVRQPRKVEWVSEIVAFQWKAFVLATEVALVLSRKTEKYAAAAAAAAAVDGASCRSLHQQRLFDGVVEMFVDGLTQDLETLRVNPAGVNGLYAKWAPSVGSFHDKAVPSLVDTIAEKVLVAELYQDGWNTLSPEGLVHARRVAYSGKVLSALRNAAKIPEHFVGGKTFDQVDYDRMPSRCRLLYGESVFAKNDAVRYNEFLLAAQVAALARMHDKSAEGPSVKTGALLPHEVTTQSIAVSVARTAAELALSDAGRGPQDTTTPTTTAVLLQKAETARAMTMQVNLQWAGLVSGVQAAMAAGQGVGRVVPVVDVSGSMGGIPMDVAVALGLLLCSANSVESGWFGKLITFHSVPEIVSVLTAADYVTSNNEPRLPDISELVRRTLAMPWGGSTDFVATMDLFLAVALQAGTPAEDVASTTICVFSDMVMHMSAHHRPTHRPTQVMPLVFCHAMPPKPSPTLTGV
jgi:hypothetical protein